MPYQVQQNKERLYLNAFHKENSEALQKAVKLTSKRKITLTDFLEQVKKVAPIRQVNRVR